MSKSNISFLISGIETGTSPEELAHRFDDYPDRRWVVGCQRMTKAGPISIKEKHSGISWDSKIDHEDVPHAAGALVDRIYESLKELQDKPRFTGQDSWTFELSIAVYCEDGRAPILSFDAEFLAKLVSIKAELDIDIYPMHPIARPKVGVTAMVTHNQRLLTGVRQGSHAAGKRAFPGGHQEMWKTWGETAVDEALEETGLSVIPSRKGRNDLYLFVTDNHMLEDEKQYTTLWIPCVLTGDSLDTDVNQKIKPLEPLKCKGWDWLTLDEVIQEILGKENYNYEDIHNQDPEQQHWLPIKLLLYHANTIGLTWPSRLYNALTPEGFWNLS